jgi:hypothetical protein
MAAELECVMINEAIPTVELLLSVPDVSVRLA